MVLPVYRRFPVDSERENGLSLGRRERDPDLVFSRVARESLGVRLERQSKRLEIGFETGLALAAVVAVDRRDGSEDLLVIELPVLAVLFVVPLAFFGDRTREMVLADGRTIEPAHNVGRGGPDDVATAEMVPKGKGKDEQEETEKKDYIEEGKGLENAVASMVDLV